MKHLIAVPFEEYTSSHSNNGVKYNVVDFDGILYLRCVVTSRKFSDHDLMIKELAEAPSNVRVAVSNHLNRVIGEGGWRVRGRLPFNAGMPFDQIIDGRLHPEAVELQYNPDENEVKRHQING